MATISSGSSGEFEHPWLGLYRAKQGAAVLMDIDGAVRDLAAITGQKPQVTKARKSIAQFKLREGMPIGTHTTLRGDRMWEFLDRLVSIALPRVRDFKGVSPKGFDGRGNYTLGVRDQLIFPEVSYAKVQKVLIDGAIYFDDLDPDEDPQAMRAAGVEVHLQTQGSALVARARTLVAADIGRRSR